MTRPSPLLVAWKYFREYFAAIFSAALIYAGIVQLISAANYPIADGVLRFINAIVHKGFRDRLLLPDPFTFPWEFHARVTAEGTIAITLGILVGLWVNSRIQRQQISD